MFAEPGARHRTARGHVAQERVHCDPGPGGEARRVAAPSPPLSGSSLSPRALLFASPWAAEL